jgi:amidophosphoribosyltransferase
MARDKSGDFKKSLINALRKVKGAYSLVILTKDALIGCRDPQGIRPLALGKLGGAYVLSSETCGLDIVQAKYVRDVAPGEVVYIDKKGLTSMRISPEREKKAYCIFEFVYFSRPDSNIFGKNVSLARKALGRQLFREHPVPADIVMPVPDSGNYAALGYAQASGIPFELGFVRNHYIGRTFIEPIQSVRDIGVKIKLNPVKNIVRGKRIALIEDSIVRGTTSQGRIRVLREAGAKEIHMRVSCPPHCFPCFLGIDFPTRRELIASSRSVEKIGKFIGVDSLRYLSLEGMLRAMPLPAEDFCTACFNGRYPIRRKTPRTASQS